MKLRYKIVGGALVLFAVGVSVLAAVVSHTSACEPASSVSSGSDTMKAVVNRCYGPPELLEFLEIDKPTPTGNEVLVRVHAAAVNPLDWHFMRGSPYIMRLATGLGAPEDMRMGVDFSGTIEAIGEEVERFKVGDEVFGDGDGAFAEYLLVSEDRAIALKPANVSFEQAAAVGVAAITALQSLRDSGKVQPGQKVLINGASGGVGTFAVQIAKSFGAEVTGVCSTRNLDMVRSIGADQVIDYKSENYTESGKRYDLIIDMVGNHSLMANRKVLADDGALVLVGGPKGDWIAPFVYPIKAFLLAPFVDPELVTLLARLSQDDLVVLAELMQAGEVTPVIDRRYSLQDVPDAIRYSESGRARGKIVINVD